MDMWNIPSGQLKTLHLSYGNKLFTVWKQTKQCDCWKFAAWSVDNNDNLWGAESRGERARCQHPSLLSGLIDHVWGWGKMARHLPQRRSTPALESELWQAAKWQQEFRQGLFSLNSGVPITPGSLFDTQLSSLLWSRQNPVARPLFPPGISTSAGKKTSTLLSCCCRLCTRESLEEFLNQIPSRVLRTPPPSIAAALAVAICLVLDSGDTEPSLLGFLRDDCCLFNNSVQARKAQSGEEPRHSPKKTYATPSAPS